MKAVIAILTASITAAAITYLVLHGYINRLQTEDQALMAQRENAPTDQNPAPEEMSNAVIPPTLSDEEALQLRREVGFLSQQTNEMQKALLADTLSFQARQISQQAKKDAAEWMLVIRAYTEDFGNSLVLTNLDQFKTLIPGGTATNLNLEQFEIVLNPAPWATNSPNAIVIRERTPRQTADGQWARVYGLVDGSVTEQISPNGYFDPWERQHLTAPQNDH